MRGKATPKKALSVLIGKRLSIWRRASTMLTVQFGSVCREGDKSWGEYALHIDCPWRLLRHGRIFTGREDLFEPRILKRHFDWDKWANENWHDNLMEAIVLSVLKGVDKKTRSIENTRRILTVTKVDVSALGDLRIHMTGGFCLETFAEGTDTEFWRLLDWNKERHHVLRARRRTRPTKGFTVGATARR